MKVYRRWGCALVLAAMLVTGCDVVSPGRPSPTATPDILPDPPPMPSAVAYPDPSSGGAYPPPLVTPAYPGPETR
jgi:hypothetical protein